MNSRRARDPEVTAGALRGALRSGLCLLMLLLAVACGKAPFELVVTFPGSIGVEPGAAVLYQGIAVGVVDDVSLHQSTPQASGRVALTLQIEDGTIVVREGDSIEVVSGGVLGEPTVRITPAPVDSAPLPSGAVVEGVPPAVTRMRESVADALESLTDAAAHAADEVAAELSRSFGILDFEGPPPSSDDFADESELDDPELDELERDEFEPDPSASEESERDF